MDLEEQEVTSFEDFYVCPDHLIQGGWESCCACGGWQEGDSEYGRVCTEAEGKEEALVVAR